MRPPAALLSFVFMCIGGMTMQAGPVTPDDACRLIEMAGASENGRASQSKAPGRQRSRSGRPARTGASPSLT